MKRLEHQPCKRKYYSDFRQRHTDVNEYKGKKKRFCYGIVDLMTDDVIPECTICDEWEFNMDFWIMEIDREQEKQNDKRRNLQ